MVAMVPRCYARTRRASPAAPPSLASVSAGRATRLVLPVQLAVHLGDPLIARLPAARSAAAGAPSAPAEGCPDHADDHEEEQDPEQDPEEPESAAAPAVTVAVRANVGWVDHGGTVARYLGN